MAGLFVRLYGLDGSLWLDEFGTLWVVEGSLAEVARRAHAFQGQSVFYYALAWLVVQLFGESELALRMVSLVLGIGAAYGIYRLGGALWGKKAGLLSASLFWLSPTIVQSSADARPYTLALLMAVVMFYGFARATQDGGPLGRFLFIAGGVGLFSAHYLLALMGAGLAAGYFLFPPLRVRYPLRGFCLDVSLQLLFVTWSLPQLFRLWSRRDSLAWFEASNNYLVVFELIGPFLLFILVPYLARKRVARTNVHQELAAVFALTIVAQTGILYLPSFLGTDLLHVRYMLVIIIPAVLLVSPFFLGLPRYLQAVPLLFWAVFVSLYFLVNFNRSGTFSGVGFQGWRDAVHCVDRLVRSDPGALVLYRSGFVEEDQLIGGRYTPATFAPLRSPGRQPVSWQLVQLTYSWNKAGREGYFAGNVEPLVREASVVYFLSCAGCYNQLTGQYAEAVVKWIEDKFPGKFHPESIKAGRGIFLIRFSRRSTPEGAMVPPKNTEKFNFQALVGCKLPDHF